MGTENDERFRRTAEAEDGAAVSAGVWLGDPAVFPDPPSAQVKAAEAFGRSFAAFLGTADPVHRRKLLDALIEAMTAEMDEPEQMTSENPGRTTGAAS